MNTAVLNNINWLSALLPPETAAENQGAKEFRC